MYFDLAANTYQQVRVGSGGAVETAPLSSSVWTSRSSGTANDLFGIIWTGGCFVAVGAAGTIVRSVDGVSWFASSGGGSEDLLDVASGFPVVIAVGNAGTALKSDDDGVTFTALATGVTENLYGITISNAEYVIVGDNSTVLYGEVTTTDTHVTVVEELQLISVPPETSLTGHNTVSERIGLDCRAGTRLPGDPAGGDFFFEVLAETMLTASASADSRWKSNAAVIESLLFSDRAYDASMVVRELIQLSSAASFGFHKQVTQAFTLGAAALVNQGYAKTASETFSLVATILLNQGYAKSVSEALTLAATAVTNQGYAKSAAETLSFVATSTVNQGYVKSASETLTLGATPAVLTVFQPLVHEALQLTGTAAIVARLLAFAEDSFTLGAVLEIPAQDYDAWVMNVENKAVSTYEEFNFESLCFSNFGAFATDGAKIYKLEGSSDAGEPIEAWLKTGDMNFGTSYMMRADRAYLGLTTDGKMMFKVCSKDGVEHWYEARFRSAGRHGQRAIFGKGNKSRYWQFELHNVLGSDFELADMELIAVQLSRKIG